MNNNPVNVRDLHFYGGGLLMNSFALTGITNSNNSIHFLDLNGNVLSNSITFSTPFISSLTMSRGTFESSVIPLKNGDLYVQHSGVDFFSLQPGFTVWTNFIKLDAALNVRWSKVYGHLGTGGYVYTAEGQKSSVATLGTENGSTVPVYSSFSGKLQFLKIDSTSNPNIQTPQASYCNLYDLSVTMTPQAVTAQQFSWTADDLLQSVTSAFNPKLLTSYAQVRYSCPIEFIDSCSFIKITGPGTVCNLDDTLVYKVHRNKACFQPVQWQAPPNSTIISQTGTELKIKINAFGNYHVGALLPFSCTPVKDSIALIAKPFEGLSLDLGRDTSLCPGNSLELIAAQGFLNYSWQDGSSGTNFTVTGPGKYWVSATDSCHNIFTDTITITISQAVPLSIGPDRIKCNNDTLHMDAPDGFLNYTWSPDNSISSVSSQHVVVNPLSDTSYFIKAEKTPGCFGMDTVKITVHKSPAINLGMDTSFCLGEQLTLNAGNNFASYQWNTGTAGQIIQATATGTYSVTATTADGCISDDTIKVISIYTLPVINLNKDNTLCIGDTRVLDAGNFSAYSWSNGSTGRTITVSTTGMYSVIVKDKNGCAATDITSITSLLPLPENFLTPSDSICQYGELILTPLTKFKSYLWSNNVSGSTAVIDAPGIYWLQVTDENNCTGKDSIIILPKECIIGFYIPSGFTPNNDGKNDRFRPLLFGDISDYQFTIYNRWGEIVFTSKKVGEGWDGSFRSKVLQTDLFVWSCSYTLKGEKPVIKKGTVTLIR